MQIRANSCRKRGGCSCWIAPAGGTLLAKSDLIRDDDGGAPPPAATDVSGGSERPNDYRNRNNFFDIFLYKQL